MARESFDNYLQRLIDLGIEKLGKGQHATVFQHPTHPNVVVKVSVEGPKSASYSWLSWSETANNRYAPKVYFLSELKTSAPAKWRYKTPPRMFIAFLEKLQPADLPTVRAFFKKHDYVFLKLEPKFWGIDDDNFEYVEDPDLLASLKAITSMGYSDLKSENIMLRGKQIVFVDPVY